MNAEKIQNDTGDQQKLIDIRVVPRRKISQLQLFHGFRCLCGGGRAEPHTAAALCVCFQNHVVIRLVLSAVLIARKRHQHLMQTENIPLPEVNIIKAQVNLIQRVPVSGDLRLIVVQGGTVLIDDGGDTLVTGNNPLNSIGAFDGLYPGDGLQLRKNLCMLPSVSACIILIYMQKVKEMKGFTAYNPAILYAKKEIEMHRQPGFFLSWPHMRKYFYSDSF